MKAIAITSPAIQTEVLLRSALDRISFLEAELQKFSNNISRPGKNIRIHQANRVITAATIEILYIQSENNYSRIFMQNGTQYYTSRTLKSWAKELSATEFLRCHRTYLVNRESIAEVNRLKNVIVLNSGIAIPTSRRFQKSCLSAIFSNSVKNENQYLVHQPVIYQLTRLSISPPG